VIIRDDVTAGGREEAGPDRRFGSGKLLDDLDSRRERRKPVEELSRSGILLLRSQGVASNDRRGEEAQLPSQAEGHQFGGQEVWREMWRAKRRGGAAADGTFSAPRK
jgi:hypothetical protein